MPKDVSVLCGPRGYILGLCSSDTQFSGHWKSLVTWEFKDRTIRCMPLFNKVCRRTAMISKTGRCLQYNLYR